MVPEAVARFRQQYRSEQVGPRYSGAAHLAFTSVAALAGVAACAVQVRAVRPLEWLAIPLSFLVANLVEHAAHRGPMHHRSRLAPLRLLYQRHLLRHHRFYVGEAMAAESRRDYKVTLFPPGLVFFFIGLQLLPIALVLRALAPPNVAWLFSATALAYFLLYEWLHLAYHLPASSWVGRLGPVARLRTHHQIHHHPAHMQKHNFNITFPIGDWLFGTTFRPPREPAPAAPVEEAGGG